MNKLALTAFNRDYQVYLFAVITSLMISLLIGYRDSIINPDGICYLMSAQMMDSTSIKDAMAFCPQAKWPFYSILIYAFQQISHLPYLVSAQILNAILTLTTVIAFMKIVETLGANRRIIWIAALIILFDHMFNGLRDNIIRDHGFWAFYLLSVYFLQLWFKKPTWTTAILWNASLIIATLFRIEGAIFLLIMPFVAFFQFQQTFFSRMKNFFMLISILVLIVTLFCIKQLWFSDDGAHQLGRVNEIFAQFQEGWRYIYGRYYAVRTGLLSHVMPAEAAPDVNAIIVFLWLGSYLYNVMLTLGWASTLLLIYAFKSRAAKITSPVIIGYLLVNVCMTLGFMAENFFTSKRYLVALMLILMLWLPFAVNDLFKKYKSLPHRLFLIIIAIVFFASALGGIVEFGRSKFFIRTAGTWIANEVPNEAKLYSNDFQLMYYSNHFNKNLFQTSPSYLQVKDFTNGKWKQYDYLALRLSGKKEGEQVAILLSELTNVTPMKIFSDKQGNRIAVYKILQDQNIKKGK